MLRECIWVESFICAGILILQWQRENFAHPQYMKFCHFQPVHCASKNPISPKVFNRFSKSLPQLEDIEGGHLGGKFHMRRFFTFAMARWNFCASTTLKFCCFQPVHCASKNPISPKVFNRFSKSLHQLEDVEGAHLGGKFHVGNILLLQWQGETFAYRQHLKFCHYQIAHHASKNPISPKVFNRFSKSLPQLEDVQGGHLCGKFHMRRYFNFAMATWKLCASTTFWNFATFNLYTVQAKVLYLQWYSTDFRNLCLCSKMLRECIWVESFICAGILILQWQRENFAHPQYMKFCHFQPVHCASKNPISPKVFNRFSKSLPQLEDIEGGHLGGKFHMRRCFTFAMARWNFCASTTLKFCCFQPVHCASKNPISPKVFNRFSKSLHQLEDVEGAHLGGKFHVGNILLLQWQGETFAYRQHLKFCHYQIAHHASKNPISPKVFNRFSKSLPQLEDVQGGHLCGKFHMRRYFNFAMATWKLCASTTFEILLLSTCTLCQQKSYISNGIQPIFEIFASARR